MLSKKHYVAFAEILSEAWGEEEDISHRIFLIEKLMVNYMREDNPRFDANRFLREANSPQRWPF